MFITEEESITKTSDETSNETDQWPLFNARDHDQKFSPLEYLQDFYATANEDVAMQIVLFFLPGIFYRLPDKVENVLDLGAGPTVYIPIAMRDRALNFFSSDYAEVNRETVTDWIKDEKSAFDWSNVCQWIGGIEATSDTPKQMEARARRIMRAVLDVDVHKQPVVQSVHYKIDETVEVPAQFDVVTTVFCLEYASETLIEYRQAVKNASTLIKPGGFLVQGGVLEAEEYGFGGRRFKSCFIRKNDVFDALKESGLETTEKTDGFHFITHDEIFLLISKKL